MKRDRSVIELPYFRDHQSWHARPPVTEGEFDEVRGALQLECSKTGISTGYDTGDDVFIDDDIFMDRTLLVAILNPRRLDEKLIALFQRSLKTYPQWRIQIGAEHEEEVIYVYVHGIRVECALPEETTAQTLDRIARNMLARDHALRRLREGRLARVQQHLAAVHRKRVARKTSLELIATFDTGSDGKIGVTVWILHRRLRSSYDFTECSFKPQALCKSRYWVVEDGSLTDFHTKDIPTDAPLLVEWCFVANRLESQPIQSLRAFSVEFNGRTYEFDV